jgi:hypothetical protein
MNDPDPFELSRRAHLVACAALAAVVVAADLLVEPIVPVLVVLIVASAVAGFLRPDGIVAGGLVIGLAIPLVRFVAALAGGALATPDEPGGAVGALSLVFLVVPALFAAVIGGYARKTLDEERRRPR